MLNQRQIKNYEVATLAELKLLNGRSREICFCTENQSFYRFDENGSAYTPNDTTIVTTMHGGDTRWLAISGKYNLNGGGSGSSEYVSLEVSQSSHGFDNDFIYNNGTVWTKALANNETTLATHFAVRVDDDNFKLIVIGEIDSTGMVDDQSAALADGIYYFLSDTIAGKVTSTAPTISQGVLKKNTGTNATVSIEIAFSIAEMEDSAFKNEDNVFTGTNTFDKELVLKEISTPSNPSAGSNKLYFKNDDKLYKLNSSGTETKIGDIDLNSLVEKTTPADDDILLIEDSEDGYNKKKVKKSDFVTGLIEKITSLTVASGENVTAQKLVELINGGVRNAATNTNGTPVQETLVTLKASNTAEIVAKKLTTNKILVVMVDNADSARGKAAIVTLTGKTVSIGSLYTFESTGTVSNISLTVISTTKAIVAYTTTGASSYLRGVVIENTSGSALSFGSALAIDTSAAANETAIEFVGIFIDTEIVQYRAIITYRTTQLRSVLVKAAANNNTLTALTPVDLTTSLAQYSNLEKINNHTYIVSYVYSFALYCKLININSETITPSKIENLLTTNSYFPTNRSQIKYVSENNAGIFYFPDSSGNAYIRQFRLLNEDEMSLDVAVLFDTSDSAALNGQKKLAKINSDKIILSYSKKDDCKFVSFNIKENKNKINTAVSVSTNYYYAGCTSATEIEGVNNEFVLFGTNSSGHLQATYVTIPADIIPQNVLGIAKETKTSGENVKISYGHEISGFSGLTQGQKYHLADDGTISTTAGYATDEIIGIATDATTIKWLNPKL